MGMPSLDSKNIAHATGVCSLFLLLTSTHGILSFLSDRAIAFSYCTILTATLFSCIPIGMLLGLWFKKFGGMTPPLAKAFYALDALTASALCALSAFELYGNYTGSQPAPVVDPIIRLALTAIVSASIGILFVRINSNEQKPMECASGDRFDPPLFALSFFFLTTNWTIYLVDGPFVLKSHLPTLFTAVVVSSALLSGACSIILAKHRINPRNVVSALWGVFCSLAILATISRHVVDSATCRLLPIFPLIAAMICAMALPSLFSAPKPKRTEPTETERPRPDKPVRQIHTEQLRRLSKKERIVLEHALEGKTSAQIANLLDIKPSTVRSYLQRSYKKLSVSSMKELRTLLPKECAIESNGKSATKCPERRVDAIKNDAAAAICGSCLIVLFHLLILAPAQPSAPIALSTLSAFALGVQSLVVIPAHENNRPIPLTVLGHLALSAPVFYVIVRTVSGIGALQPTAQFDQLLHVVGLAALGRFLGTTFSTLCSATSSWSSKKRVRIASASLAMSSLTTLLASLVPQLHMPTLLLSLGLSIAISIGMMAIHEKALETRCQENTIAHSQIESFSLPNNALGALFWVGLGIYSTEAQAPFASQNVFILPTLYLLSTFLVFFSIAFRPCAGFDKAICIAAFFGFSISGTVVRLGLSTLNTVAFLYGPTMVCIGVALATTDANDVRQRLHPPLYTWLPIGVFAGQLVNCGNTIAPHLPATNGLFAIFESERIASLHANLTLLLLLFAASGIVALFLFTTNITHINNQPQNQRKVIEIVSSYLISQGLAQYQCDILSHIYAGLSATEISEKLHYSIGTINSVRFFGYQKFGVHSRKQFIDNIDSRIHAGE